MERHTIPVHNRPQLKFYQEFYLQTWLKSNFVLLYILCDAEFMEETTSADSPAAAIPSSPADDAGVHLTQAFYGANFGHNI